MINFNDPNLVFEHKLRDYTIKVKERIEQALMAAGDSYARVTLEFDASDGGKWRIYAYHKGIGTDIKGAELHRVADTWINTFYAQHSITVLPALIGHSPASDDTSDVLRVDSTT